MNRFLSLLVILIITAAGYSGLFAQNYVIKERNISFEQDQLMTLIGEDNFSDTPDGKTLAKLLIDMPLNDMLSKLKNEYQLPEMMETTIYISGNNLRVDVNEEGAKSSQFIMGDKKAVYHVMWDKKQYIEMTYEDIQNMQKQATAMTNQYMKNMPPEIQAQIEAQMGQSKKDKSQSKISKTGRKQAINNFPCEEYHVEKASELRQLWVTGKFPELRKSMEEMFTLLSGFGPQDDDDNDMEIWEKIPGSWPVLTKDINFNNMYMSISMDVDETISVERKNIAADMFIIPGDFKKVSMMDMMRGGMDY